MIMRTALQIALRDINRLIAQESYNTACKCQLEEILAELSRYKLNKDSGHR